MVKFYKHLMKTMFLVCFLLMGGSNYVWGAMTWTGGSTSPGAYSNTYKQIGSTTVYLKGNGSNISYDTSNKGFKIKYKTYVYLSARNTDGIVTITLQGGGSLSNNDVTISENKTEFSVVEKKKKKNSSTGDGTSITFEMKKDLDYSIYSSQQLFIKKVVFNVEGTDYIVLDETKSKSNNESLINSANAATNPSMKMLKLVRTLKAGQWNTFCLPVTINAVTAPTFSTQLKCEAAYELADYDNSTHTITFSPIKANNTGAYIYRANTPCLIKPSEDIVNPIILGGGAIQAVSNLAVTKGDITFTGVYGAENIYTTGDDNSTKFYLNNDGYLVYPTSNEGNKGMIKGFRAYFQCEDLGALTKSMTFIFDDSETSGMKTIEHDVILDDNRIYSIDGRFLGNSTDNLPRGMYIQNGRKFVVN